MLDGTFKGLNQSRVLHGATAPNSPKGRRAEEQSGGRSRTGSRALPICLAIMRPGLGSYTRPRRPA